MATLQIDGIGKVNIDDGFLKLSPEQQAAEVDAIAAQIKGGTTPTPAAAAAAPQPPDSEESIALQQINASQPRPETLASRSSILPVGRTKEGDLTLAMPGFLEGPRQAVMDLIDGKRTASQLTGKEIFELGILFAGAPGGSGGLGLTGAGRGAPAAGAAVPAVAEDAARAATPEAAAATPAAPAAASQSAPVTVSRGATAENLAATKALALQRADELEFAAASEDMILTPAERAVYRDGAQQSRRLASDMDKQIEAIKGGTAQRTDFRRESASPAAPPPPPAAAGPAVAEPAIATATNAELRASAKGFYKQADEAGVVIKPGAIKALYDDTFETIAKEGLDPTLHPRATAALKRIEELTNQPVAFQTVEILRRVAQAAGKGIDKDEGRIAGQIVDKIDDFVAGLSAKDLVVGDAKVAAEAVTKARDLWSRVAKLDTVEKLVENARLSASNFSASGFENALRTEFRALAKNARAIRTFTAEEQKAIKKIAMGTPVSNAARAAGKFAPTGVVSTVLSGGTGAAVGGGIGAVALPAAGFLARRLATAMAERYVKQLEATIRTGGDSQMATEALKRSKASLQFLKSAP